MNNTIFYSIIFLFIPFGIFFLLSWLVTYHLKAYGLKGSFSDKAKVIFLIGIIIISLVALQKFLFIDWNNFYIEDLLQNSNINFFPEKYG